MSKMIPFPKTFHGEQEERTVMCPVAQLALRAISGPLCGRQFAFDGSPFRIGRDPGCTVAIPSQGVSRNHARIEFGDGGYWLVPEKTVNGSRINSQLVHEPTQLADRDQIAIYDSTFVVEYRNPLHDDELGELAPPPPAVIMRPSLAGMPTMHAMSAPVIDAPRAVQAVPPRMRWLWAAVAGVAFLGIVAGVVAVTVRVVQPAAVPQPIITMVPTPATPVTAPAAAVPPATPPSAARLEGVLTVETTQVIANERGTIVDVAAVGAAIARNAPVAHVRKYSAAFEQAKARLAFLQAHFGKSPEHADFIEQARGDYLLARNRRQVLPVVTSVGGTITKIEVKAGQDYRATTVIAELAVGRITVPVAAVDGTGTKCTAHLDNGKQLTGMLLAVGATERTLELDRMPTHASPGELGEVHIHCSDD